jgi:RNA polymerase sigma factor (sigma-70 family)
LGSETPLGAGKPGKAVESEAPTEKQSLSPEIVAQLHDAHSRELLLFLTGVLRDAHLASDVVQITFSRLLEQGGQTAQETRKAWLFRVAYNEALDWRRKQTRRERLLPEAMSGRPFVAAEPIAEILQGELVENVRAAIKKLPAAQQEIVRRRMYQEQTFAEIAKELRIPLGTALGRMRQALEHLRRLMNSTHDQ